MQFLFISLYLNAMHMFFTSTEFLYRIYKKIKMFTFLNYCNIVLIMKKQVIYKFKL